MEIIKAKNNNDRALVRINFKKIRIVAEESKSHRIFKNRIGLITMFDFAGGPNFTIGGKLEFEKLFWKINKITKLKTNNPLCEIVLEVSPIYSNKF